MCVRKTSKLRAKILSGKWTKSYEIRWQVNYWFFFAHRLSFQQKKRLNYLNTTIWLTILLYTDEFSLQHEIVYLVVIIGLWSLGEGRHLYVRERVKYNINLIYFLRYLFFLFRARKLEEEKKSRKITV